MQRRRKKRGPNWRGTRNVEVERGAAGSFGITISGQKPCILSSIAENSPAHLAGLRAGDFLISINGLNVSKLQHEIIVQLINNANPKIWMSIAENFYKSDSSDDDTPLTPGGGGRSYSGELAQRMRPKYSGNKLKGDDLLNCTLVGHRVLIPFYSHSSIPTYPTTAPAAQRKQLRNANAEQ